MIRKFFILFFYLINIISNAQVITDDLVLHLDANNTNSYSGIGNTWNDLSPSGNNGIINGATFNSSNKSFDFDGSNDLELLKLQL